MSRHDDRTFLDRLPGPGDPPLILAHRGDCARGPENTLLAAFRGWERGADGWEFDVQLTRDGVPVVLHDESLARTTDVAARFRGDPRGRRGYPVSKFDYAEIRTLNAGAWFVTGGPSVERSSAWFGDDSRVAAEDRAACLSDTVRVPTLREALELTERLDWLANVELKTFPNRSDRLLDAVVAEVDRLGVHGRVLISAFDHRELTRAAALRPLIPAAALVAQPLDRPAAYLRSVPGARCVHPSAAVLGAEADRYLDAPTADHLDVETIEAFRRAGVPVLVWTVNDPGPDGLARHLADAGVAGLFTDDVEPLRALFGG